MAGISRIANRERCGELWETSVHVRRSAGAVDALTLARLSLEAMGDSVPFRSFRWNHGQPNFPGSFWSEKMQAHVGYESRLELSHLLVAEFDHDVVRMWSQPFKLLAASGTRRAHVPDYLFERRGGRGQVMDVKRAVDLEHPKVAATLQWTRELMDEHGWEYSVVTEPDPVYASNVQFLSDYRRSAQFDEDLVERVATLIDGPMTVSEARAAAATVAPSERIAPALVLRLLWLQRLNCDLTQQLQSTTMVRPV